MKDEFWLKKAEFTAKFRPSAYNFTIFVRNMELKIQSELRFYPAVISYSDHSYRLPAARVVSAKGLLIVNRDGATRLLSRFQKVPRIISRLCGGATILASVGAKQVETGCNTGRHTLCEDITPHPRPYRCVPGQPL